MSYINPISTVINLGVNIDHIATLRNARGTAYPDLLEAALQAEEAGADVITLHLREDRRHIKDIDVEIIRPKLQTRMNLEAAATQEMIDFACKIKPQDSCIVPERRYELTTEGGLDIVQYFTKVQTAVRQLQAEAIRVSLFIDPDIEQIQAAAEIGVSVIELHTGRYTEAHDETEQYNELERIQLAVQEGIRRRLKVNAGHGLHYANVQKISEIIGISELNIGHSIVSRAIFVGWKAAISEMKACIMRGYSLNSSK